MSAGGTARYADATHVPPLVVRAVVLANELGSSTPASPNRAGCCGCSPRVARGGRIGETGTGCGVGLAWMVSGAESRHDLRLRRTRRRTGDARARALFANHPNVTIVTGDWTAILEHGPFDLLVLDGGGAGKGDDAPVDPDAIARPRPAPSSSTTSRPRPRGHPRTTARATTRVSTGSNTHASTRPRSAPARRARRSSPPAAADATGGAEPSTARPSCRTVSRVGRCGWPCPDTDKEEKQTHGGRGNTRSHRLRPAARGRPAPTPLGRRPAPVGRERAQQQAVAPSIAPRGRLWGSRGASRQCVQRAFSASDLCR